MITTKQERGHMIMVAIISYVMKRKLNVTGAFSKLLIPLMVSLVISGLSSIPILPLFTSILLPEWYALPLSFPFYFTISRSPLAIYPPIFILRFYFFGLPLYTVSGQWLTYVPPVILYAFIPFICINLVSSLFTILFKSYRN